jgi:hypothetical protein
MATEDFRNGAAALVGYRRANVDTLQVELEKAVIDTSLSRLRSPLTGRSPLPVSTLLDILSLLGSQE